jgi:hypothetical protein
VNYVVALPLSSSDDALLLNGRNGGVHLPHINQHAHALSTSVLRQTVWFSPLGAANQETAEKTAMKMMEMRMDQL